MSSHSDSLRKKLVKILSDHKIHSGADLARHMAVSRTAIWKHINYLRLCGLDIDPVQGQGYQLNQVVDLLDKKKIQAQISARSGKKIRSLQLLFEAGSTNQLMVDRLSDSSLCGDVIIAEYQSQGRGRGGNTWISPMGVSINLSLGWHYEIPPKNAGCMSLACGVVVMRVFKKLGIQGTGLKWPNDIFANDRKLGGILVEMRGENAGPVDVITGIGLNVSSAEAITTIDQPTTEMAALTDTLPSRNHIAGLLIDELVIMLDQFPDMERGKILNEWRRYDCAKGRQATVTLPGTSWTGSVMGIDDEGLLLMRIKNKVRKFTSGQVSLAVRN